MIMATRSKLQQLQFKTLIKQIPDKTFLKQSDYRVIVLS